MRISIIVMIAMTGTLATGNEGSITFPKASEPENSIGQQGKEPQEFPLREMAYHVASLGLKTLRNLVSGHSNVIISPINVYSCLGIINLGASGETEQELRRILGPLNESSNITVSEIMSSKEGLSHASALFLDHGFTAKREFIDAAFREFETSVLNVNVSDGEQSKTIINRWVSDHTNGTIIDLLQERPDPNTKIIVVSTLLFQGKWLHSFPMAATAPGKFEVEEGVFVDVPLMKLFCTVPVIRNPYFDAISLLYKDERNMTMHLILPKVHGVVAVKQLLSHLNVNSIKKLRRDSVYKEVLVVIPRINIDSRFSLTNSLMQQGVVSMFSPSKANFTNLANDRADVSKLFVSEVYQSVHFEMNEEGTTAAAATALILTKTKKFNFLATRPFIFIITDESDIVLFMGVVARPE